MSQVREEGAVLIEFPNLNCALFGVHVAFKNEYIQRHKIELDVLYKNLKEKYTQIIFAGDFNRDATFYNDTSFGNEMRSTKTERTFPSFFPFYQPLSLFSKDIVSGAIDTVYATGQVEIVDSEVIKSRSDHKMVITEVLLNNS